MLSWSAGILGSGRYSLIGSQETSNYVIRTGEPRQTIIGQGRCPVAWKFEAFLGKRWCILENLILLLLLNFEMWWNDNLEITIICHQVLYSGVSGGNKRRSTCTQTSTGETWWDKPMSFIFLVSCQPFWFYKAIISIVISWMVPWMTFLALMSLFSGLVWSWDRICSTRRGYRVPQTSWGKVFVIIPSSSIASP